MANLKLHVSEISPTLVELEVTLPWEEIGQRLDRLYARVGKDAHVRGFRKGKVPRQVLERFYGDQVMREALSDLVETRLVEAIRQSGRRAVATRSVQPGPIEPGKPLKFTAKVEVLPTIEAIVTDGLVAERPSTLVAETDVDRELERLRQENAELAPIDPPRGAAKGDVVLVDYDATLAGEKEPASKADGRRLELGGGDLLPGFEEAILGAGEGDRREATITFPEDHSRPDLRGKKATFRILVREVRAKILPEIDDEFARDLGEHDTLAALRESIQTGLAKARATSAERAVERSVLEDLARKNPIGLPPALVESQAEGMEQELLQMVAPGGAKPGERMRLSDEIRAQLRAQAEARVRSSLLVTELAKREKLTVSDEDIEAHLEALAVEVGKNVAKVKAEYAKADRRERLRGELVEKKVVEMLLAKAKVVEVAAEHDHEHGHDHEHEHGHEHGHEHHHDHHHDEDEK